MASKQRPDHAASPLCPARQGPTAAVTAWANRLIDSLADIPTRELATLRQQAMEVGTVTANTASITKAAPMEPLTPSIITDDAALKALARRVQGEEALAIDIETSSLDPRKGVIVGLGMALADATFYIPINHHFETGGLRPNQLPLAQVLDELQLQTKPLIADNGKFEFKWLHHHGGIACDSLWDTMLAARLLRSDQSAELKAVVEREMDVPRWDLPQAEMKQIQLLPIEKVAAYCAKDCWYTRLLWLKQREMMS